jgi:hypothetical protein
LSLSLYHTYCKMLSISIHLNQSTTISSHSFSVKLHLVTFGESFRLVCSKSEPQFRNPRVRLLWDRWRNVWMLSWERQRRLHDRLKYLIELEKVRNFSWDDWRKRVRRSSKQIGLTLLKLILFSSS